MPHKCEITIPINKVNEFKAEEMDELSEDEMRLIQEYYERHFDTVKYKL